MTERSPKAVLTDPWSGPWRARAASGLLALALWLTGVPCDGFANGLDEHELRALFLFNFASFVRWPDEAFEDPSSPFRYCVVGDGKIDQPLRTILQGESVNGHPLEFRKVTVDAIPHDCHLLFINPTNASKTADITAQLAGRPTLTVSDDRDLIASGIMVSLDRRGARIRPVVNLDTARSSGLSFSAKFLQLSTVVSAR